jgi:predicted dienelactone hydrolase
MRALEWLLLLAFGPILLLPWIRPPWRRRWVRLAAPLPVLALLPHLASEGWRLTLIPAYILAALMVICRLPALRGNPRPERRGWGILASSLTALVLLLSGLLAGWLLPVVRLPDPSGPYPVGIVDRMLVDASRGRRLMVSVWYPAAAAGPPAPLFSSPDVVIPGLAASFGLPAPLLHHLRYSTVGASAGAPLRADPAPFPVLMFSHGLVGLRQQNSSLLQELASWGYVVVAIDHTDAAAITVFPDGEARRFDLTRFGLPAGEPSVAQMADHVLPAWVADQRFVFATLEQWADSDPLFAGALDLTRLGAFGHSFGGATSVEFCRIEPRCRAVINLDGGLYGDSLTQPAVRPLLLLTSADSRRLPDALAAWSHMIEIAQVPATWIELEGSTHLSLTISALISPLLGPADYDPRAGLRVVDTSVRAFFDRHLRGMAVDLPAPGTTDPALRWRTPVP